MNDTTNGPPTDLPTNPPNASTPESGVEADQWKSLAELRREDGTSGETDTTAVITLMREFKGEISIWWLFDRYFELTPFAREDGEKRRRRSAALDYRRRAQGKGARPTPPPATFRLHLI